MKLGVAKGDRHPSPEGRRPLGWAILSAGLGALLFLLPVAAGAAPPPIFTDTSPAWTNGEVACTFETSHPALTAAATGATDTGFYVGVGQLEELGPGGRAVALADMVSTHWTIRNESNASTFWLAYSGDAVEVASSAAAPPLGIVAVHVGFMLPAYHESSGTEPSTVVMAASFTNWTWQANGDSLAVVLPVWPAFSTTEHMTSGDASSVLSVSNQSGRTLEYLQPDAAAQVSLASGSHASVPASVSSSLSPSYGTVTVVFGSGAGEFHSVAYTARIGVVLSTTVLGVPLYEYAAAGGLAVVVSALLAAGVRTVRKRPSDLVYAEEGR